MRTWDIAKLLIEGCSSPQEVAQVIRTLQDAGAMQQVCSLLAAFSSDTTSSVERGTEICSREGIGSYGMSTEVNEPAARKARNDRAHSSKAATAPQLESLFRISKLTNKQVEWWLDHHFGVQVTVGKSSLRKYLNKVLEDIDLGLTNRILAAAQRLANDQAISTSEVRNYWDRFDKHFATAE